MKFLRPLILVLLLLSVGYISYQYTTETGLFQVDKTENVTSTTISKERPENNIKPTRPDRPDERPDRPGNIQEYLWDCDPEAKFNFVSSSDYYGTIDEIDSFAPFEKLHHCQYVVRYDPSGNPWGMLQLIFPTDVIHLDEKKGRLPYTVGVFTPCEAVAYTNLLKEYMTEKGYTSASQAFVKPVYYTLNTEK